MAALCRLLVVIALAWVAPSVIAQTTSRDSASICAEAGSPEAVRRCIRDVDAERAKEAEFLKEAEKFKTADAAVDKVVVARINRETGGGKADSGANEGPGLLAELFMGLLFLAIYFAPALVASRRDHKNATAITVLNLFLGWTLLGWVVALVWAVSK